MLLNQNDKTRYYSNIAQSGLCLLWTGATCEDGYGRMSLNKKTTLVHKIAYFLKHGKEPQDYLIHTCDNKMCVNPDHIVEGKNKGRPVKVSAQIIKDLNSQGLSPSQIADQLNCSVSLVRKRLN
jgi:hypothetical protein